MVSSLAVPDSAARLVVFLFENFVVIAEMHAVLSQRRQLRSAAANWPHRHLLRELQHHYWVEEGLPKHCYVESGDSWGYRSLKSAAYSQEMTLLIAEKKKTRNARWQTRLKVVGGPRVCPIKITEQKSPQ